MRRSARIAALTASLATVLSGGLMTAMAGASSASAGTGIQQINLHRAYESRVGHEKLVNTSPLPTRSDHWAGYWATAPAGKSIYGVDADLIVPKVNCSLSRGTAPYDAVFWSGLGGQDGTSLVQTGVYAECDTLSSKPDYVLFWEIWPQLSIQLGWPGYNNPIHVHPGDDVESIVLAPGLSPVAGKYEMATQVISASTGQESFYSKYRSPPTLAVGSTAEVITERSYSGTTGSFAGLAGFGTAHFYNALYMLSPQGLYADAEPMTQHQITMYHQHLTSQVDIVRPSATSDGGETFSTQRTGNW
jgi:hypothetical protein